MRVLAYTLCFGRNVEIRIIMKKSKKLELYLMKLKPYFILIRPFTLLAPFVATLCSILMSTIFHGQIHLFYTNWALVLMAGMSMALAQMCGQVINQAEDPVEMDIINGKTYRPIPQNDITQVEARRIGVIAGVTACIISFAIDLSFGMGIAILIFFAAVYSIEPIRIKRRKIINVVWLGVSRGFLPVLVAWSVFYTPWESFPIALSLILFFWVTGFQITKDFPDIPGDRQYSVMTFPVAFGFENTKKFMHLMNGLAFVVLIISLIIGILPLPFLIVMLLFPAGVRVIRGIQKNTRRGKAVENSPEWMFFYLGLASLYVLFTIALVIP